MTALVSLVLLGTTWVADEKPTRCDGVFALIERSAPEVVRAALTPATLDAPGTGACAKRTPLLAAAEWGRPDVVEVLLAMGADVNFTVVERQGPLQGRVTAECLARANGHDAVGAMLRKRGAKDTRDGCLKRAALVAAVAAEDAVRLAKERKAGNRLPPAQLVSALKVTDCGAARGYCTELVRHLPKEPSELRDQALDELETWVEVLPGLREQLASLRRARDARFR
ncbi:MAG: hypothetical protein MUC96_00280 [Myxococcaceae bacterium]|nr:hypothetical protein [Myxococcaceae bacterium]